MIECCGINCDALIRMSKLISNLGLPMDKTRRRETHNAIDLVTWLEP